MGPRSDAMIPPTELAYGKAVKGRVTVFGTFFDESILYSACPRSSPCAVSVMTAGACCAGATCSLNDGHAVMQFLNAEMIDAHC